MNRTEDQVYSDWSRMAKAFFSTKTAHAAIESSERRPANPHSGDHAVRKAPIIQAKRDGVITENRVTRQLCEHRLATKHTPARSGATWGDKIAGLCIIILIICAVLLLIMPEGW